MPLDALKGEEVNLPPFNCSVKWKKVKKNWGEGVIFFYGRFLLSGYVVLPSFNKNHKPPIKSYLVKENHIGSHTETDI